jgi:hypothetical protein
MQDRAEMKLIFQNIFEHVENNFEIKENNIERNSKYQEQNKLIQKKFDIFSHKNPYIERVKDK